MSSYNAEGIGKDGIVLSRGNSRNLIHVPLAQIEALASEKGCTADEIIRKLSELVASGAMGEGWDVSRFYNMPATASDAEAGWDVSRFYSMPAEASSGEGWDVSRFYNMPANASSEAGWDVSRFYNMPASSNEGWDVSRFYSMPEANESSLH